MPSLWLGSGAEPLKLVTRVLLFMYYVSNNPSTCSMRHQRQWRLLAANHLRSGYQNIIPPHAVVSIEIYPQIVRQPASERASRETFPRVYFTGIWMACAAIQLNAALGRRRRRGELKKVQAIQPAARQKTCHVIMMIPLIVCLLSLEEYFRFPSSLLSL